MPGLHFGTRRPLPACSAWARALPEIASVIRTVAEGMYEHVPHGDFTIFESYVRALRSARRLIYLENQFLWAPEIVEILADKLRNPPHPDFRLVLLLPSKANNGHDDTRGQLAVLSDVDDGPGVSRHSRRLLGPLEGLIADG
jgi:hypothetical protein